MSRLNTVCAMDHTPLSPGKSSARNRCFWSVPSEKDIITISPAALSEINTIRWNVSTNRQGRVLVIDKDPGAIEIAKHIREGDKKNGKASEYPRLRFLPEQLGNVEDIIPNYYLARFGVKDLGCIDLDLTGTIEQVAPIANRIASAVREHKFRRGIQLFVTFRNGRDEYGWNASEKRVNAIAFHIGMKHKWAHFYRSEHRDRNLQQKIGSSMAVVAFRF